MSNRLSESIPPTTHRDNNDPHRELEIIGFDDRKHTLDTLLAELFPDFILPTDAHLRNRNDENLIEVSINSIQVGALTERPFTGQTWTRREEEIARHRSEIDEIQVVLIGIVGSAGNLAVSKEDVFKVYGVAVEKDNGEQTSPETDENERIVKKHIGG